MLLIPLIITLSKEFGFARELKTIIGILSSGTLFLVWQVLDKSTDKNRQIAALGIFIVFWFYFVK